MPSVEVKAKKLFLKSSTRLQHFRSKRLSPLQKSLATLQQMNKLNQQRIQLKHPQVSCKRKVIITGKPSSVFLNRILNQYMKLKLQSKINLNINQLRLQKFKKKKLKCYKKRLKPKNYLDHLVLRNQLKLQALPR